MKVKIIKCSGDYWYKDRIGEVVEIECCGNNNKYLLKDEELLNKKYYFLIDKDDCVEVNEKSITQAISLLQSHGYKVEAPYIDPTDEEIIARVKADNEKAGWTADWDKLIDEKYYILYSHRINRYTKECAISCRSLSETYTNQQIAETIVDELNEGRFVRV